MGAKSNLAVFFVLGFIVFGEIYNVANIIFGKPAKFLLRAASKPGHFSRTLIYICQTPPYEQKHQKRLKSKKLTWKKEASTDD